MDVRTIARRRFGGIESKVNLFFLSSALGMALLVLLIAYKQGVFINHTPIYFYTDNALGISVGIPVDLYGFTVGEVKDMTMETNEVKVELSIVSEYIPNIPKNSKVTLVQEGYIGSSMIEILPNKVRTQIIEEKDVLEYTRGKGVVELVDDLKKEFAPVLKETREMLGYINDPKGDVKKSVAGARATVEQLPETNKKLQQTLERVDSGLLAFQQKSGRAFDEIAETGATLRAALPQVSAQAGASLEHISAAADEIREVTHDTGQNVKKILNKAPDLMDRGRDLAERGQDLVEQGNEIAGAIKKSWPVAGHLAPPQTSTLEIDSGEKAETSTR